MELQFRNKHGIFLFAITGEKADMAHFVLSTMPELRKEKMNITGKVSGNKGEFLVFKCLKKCGYTILGGIEFILDEGDYIKILK